MPIDMVFHRPYPLDHQLVLLFQVVDHREHEADLVGHVCYVHVLVGRRLPTHQVNI